MTISLATVDEILRSEDMEGLLAVGAPSDEYAQEARQIKSLLDELPEDQVSRDKVAALILEVWQRAFGPFSTEDLRNRSVVIEQLTRRILEHTPVSIAHANVQRDVHPRL